jgi:hypothetical protein
MLTPSPMTARGPMIAVGWIMVWNERSGSAMVTLP